MIIKWVGLGILGLCFLAYDSFVNGPKRHAQVQWDHEHFNGWRLQKETYDTEHGLYRDNLNKETCTTVGYPGYPACPIQAYFVDGSPQAAKTGK
jgi:hypothetical protein